MWVSLLLCFVFGLSVSATDQHYNSWKPKTEYKYDVRGRTLTGIHQLQNQYAGLMVRANLIISPKDDETVSGRIENYEYGRIHNAMPGGWSMDLPESSINYQQVPMSQKPFEIQYKNGAIVEMKFESDVPVWEINMIKSVVSQLQVDATGHNMISSPYNQRPNENNNAATFKTMEPTVTGNCETLYDISPIPPHALRHMPLVHYSGNGDLIEIIKTKNLVNCDERVEYHYGLPESVSSEANANVGTFASVSSGSNIVVSGNLNRHTILSSVTVNEIVMSPTLYNAQKGTVVSVMNLTLSKVENAERQPEELALPQSAGNLVYSFSSPFSNDNVPHVRRSHQDFRWQSGDKNLIQNNIRETSRSRRSMKDSVNELYMNHNQQRPTLENPPETPLLPYYIGNMGKSIKNENGVNIIEAVTELTNEIAQDLQNSDRIAEHGMLDSFSNLVSALSIMSLDELQQTTGRLYAANSADSNRALAWKVYRDALVRVGTGPALLQIKELIMSQKMNGEEAAEIISDLPKNARIPTVEYMDAFFDLAINLTKRPHLGHAAILAFTELARVAGHRDSAHSVYPVHSFDNYADEIENKVKSTYLPYLDKQLQDAVHRADSHAIQVYIRAIGNLARPEIFQSYKPYLEGKQKMSDYQRLLIVTSMDEIAKMHPEETRSVLYKIYSNPGEKSEVRVAAVYQLMRTVPPAYMLQRMALYSNVDRSLQVQAAVKSALESAAKMTQSKYSQLAANAQTAHDMLNPHVRSLQYSRNYLGDYVVKEMNLAYKQNIGYEGSDDSEYPKSVYYSIRWNRGGLEEQPFSAGSSVSSVRSLVDVFKHVFASGKRPSLQNEQRDSWADKISKMLNIQFDSPQQLEGNVFLKLAGTKRFMAFDNHTIEKLPLALAELSQLLKTGHSFNYTKLFGPRDMIIAFPTEMGLPFVYETKSPSVINVGGRIKVDKTPSVQSQGPDKIRPVEVDGDVHITVATRLQSKLSFVTPFDRHQYIAGYDKNMQVQVPLVAKMNIDIVNRQMNARVALKNHRQNTNLVHYSTWPYTSSYDITTMKPVSADHNTHHVQASDSKRYVEKTVGRHSLGMAFKITAETDNKQMFSQAWWSKMYQRHDFVSALWAPFYENSLQQINFNIDYDASQSNSDALNIMAHYKDWHSGKLQDSLSYASKQQREFMKSQPDNIYHRSATILVKSENEVEPQYMANIIQARDKDSRANYYLNYRQFSEKNADYQPHYFSLAATNTASKTPAMDFMDMLKYDPSYMVNVNVIYGDEHAEKPSAVSVKANFKRTNERQQYLKNSQMGKQCIEEMARGYHALPTCANMTVQAGYLNEIEVRVHYENIEDTVQNVTERAYRHLRHCGHRYYSENNVNAVGSGDSNIIKMDVQIDPDLEHAGISIHTPNSDALFKNMPVHAGMRSLVVAHPYFNMVDRIKASVTKQNEKSSSFILDNKMAVTLNNRTYPLSLTRSWHVAMYGVENKSYRPEVSFIVLVRKVHEQLKAVKIILHESDGHETVLDFIPDASAKNKNAMKKIQAKRLNAPIPVKEGRRLVESNENSPYIYELPNGVVKFTVPGKFYMLYDDSRATFVVKDKYRNSVRGLSGPYDGEPNHDFTNPENRILQDSRDFVASYALPEDSETTEIQENAKKAKSYPKLPSYRDVVSERDSHSVSDTIDYKCTKKQTQYKLEEDGKVICFTTSPLPVCLNHCKTTKSSEERVEVHCVQRTPVSDVWRKQIEKGVNPDFSSKKPTKSIVMSVARNCEQI